MEQGTAEVQGGAVGVAAISRCELDVQIIFAKRQAKRRRPGRQGTGRAEC